MNERTRGLPSAVFQAMTSGLGGIFPRGIPIGQIVDAQEVEYGLATEARVKLNVMRTTLPFARSR